MQKPDKWEALQAFWGSFDIPAYDENTIPESAEMPYIAYEAKTANFEKPLYLTASIYYYSTSWKAISQKAKQIEEYIGYGSKILPVDGGYLYITQGSPFAQRMSDGANKEVRRIIINIAVEFFTAN